MAVDKASASMFKRTLKKFVQMDPKPGCHSIAELASAIDPNAGINPNMLYRYFTETIQPAAATAFYIGEALGPKSEDDGDELGHPQCCGAAMIAIAGRFKELVLLIASTVVEHPDTREDLCRFASQFQILSDPAIFAEHQTPLLSENSRTMCRRVFHKVFGKKRVRALDQSAKPRFEVAFHIAANRRGAFKPRLSAIGSQIAEALRFPLTDRIHRVYESTDLDLAKEILRIDRD